MEKKNLTSVFLKLKETSVICKRLRTGHVATATVPSSTTSIKIHSFLVSLAQC